MGTVPKYSRHWSLTPIVSLQLSIIYSEIMLGSLAQWLVPTCGGRVELETEYSAIPYPGRLWPAKKQGKSRSKSGQEKLEGIQAKLNNKNLSNKRRKELKKAGRKVANEERRKAENEDDDPEEVVIANVK